MKIGSLFQEEQSKKKKQSLLSSFFFLHLFNEFHVFMSLFDTCILFEYLEPMEKTINLSESTKNAILITEGILLFLCVMGPSFLLLFKVRNSSCNTFLCVWTF